MKRKNLIDTIKDKIFKFQAQSYEPFKVAPLTEQEKDLPIESLLGDQSKRQKAPIAVDKDKPQAAQPLAAPAAVPMADQINIVNVKKYLKDYTTAFKIMYDKLVEEIGPQPKFEAVNDEFRDFVQLLRNNLRLVKDQKERKEREAAIQDLSNEFNARGIDILRNVDIVANEPVIETVPAKQIQKPHLPKNKNYTEQEVRTYLRAIAKLNNLPAVNAEALAIEICKSLPEFRDNEENMQILEQIESSGLGRHKTIRPANISNDDRDELVRIFFSSYLNEPPSDLPDDVRKDLDAKRLANWSKIVGDVQLDDISKAQELYEERSNVDIVDYIRKGIFSPSVKNKETFLEFFLSGKAGVLDRLSRMYDKAAENYLSEDDLNTLEDEMWLSENRQWKSFMVGASAGKKDANMYSFMQQEAMPLFVNELKSIMQNDGDPLHQTFFNWICGKVFTKSYSETGYKQEHAMQGRGANLEGEQQLELSEEQKATSAKGFNVQRFMDKVVNVNSLNSCKDFPKLKAGMVPNIAYFDCLSKDWKQISGYMKTVLLGIQSRYNSIPSVSETVPQLSKEQIDIKIDCLQKMILWEKLYDSVRDTMQEVLRAKTRTSKPLTDDMFIKILNRQWYDVFDAKQWQDTRFDKEDDKVIKYCEKGERDLGIPFDTVYTKIFSDKISEYKSRQSVIDEFINSKIDEDTNLKDLVSKYGRDSWQVKDYLKTDKNFKQQIDAVDKSNKNILNILQQKARYDLYQYKDILLSPEVLDKFGGETVLTFMEMMKIRPEHEQLGILVSRQNLGTYNDKIDYLYEILRRGAKFDIDGSANVSAEDLKLLSATQIDTIFATVRETLKLLYGGTSALKEALGSKDSSISDAFVAELAQKAGVTEIKNKASYKAAPLAEKNKINSAFIQTQLGKYHIETVEMQNAYVAWLAKFIQTACTMTDIYNGKFGFASKESFLESIGIDPYTLADFSATEDNYQDILEQIDTMPKRDLFKIGTKYFPQLNKAYDMRRLQKGQVQSKSEQTMMSIEKILIDEAISKGLEEPSVKRFATGIEDGLFFAEVLDAASHKPAKLAQVMSNYLQKMAEIQKK
jgi:hypothetical protein